jgi:adenylate kinase
MALVVILLGAPGAGKGTQAARLSQARGLPHVSTGDLLRDHRARGTPLGREAQGFMDKGELVPDALVLDMLAERVARPDCSDGYVLDGFPRTEVQARALEQRLKPGDEVRVANLEVSDEAIVSRVSGRLSCPGQGCGRVYHTQSAPPRSAGLCDACGRALAQRPDDAAPVVRERLRVYHQKTAPLVDYYARRGLLTAVDGEQAPEAVFARLSALFPEKARR